MKNLIIPILGVIFGLYAFTTPESSEIVEAYASPNECLVKVRSGWGFYTADCAANYHDSYTVVYANECDYALDAKVCVQQEHGRWMCFTKFNMLPGDSIKGHVCIGTGKRLKFARRAGNSEIRFPTDEDVNNQY